ncbi:M14 family metallopeptidase [uncultured Draconibacterium sp.]|uniref:M14 family metallopeptidase n=1 Tax=uncultured Draconibacterium sp. TaxID=1573823 RepID=UPI0025FC14F8|nr:M14 family metallopeptidase [uncultured Draconibacterium sp.]
MVQKIYTLLLLLGIALSSFAGNNPKIEVPLRFDHYYDYEDVVKALEVLHEAYPELTKLESIGESEEGLKIYALTINNKKTGHEHDKPGVWLDGNIHGNEIQAGEVCLYYANMLLTKYGENKKITEAVDRNVHYIIPVINVDGRSHFFKDGHTPSSSRSLRVPKDDDGDGLFDEDAPDDLDGDGSICQMRIKDENGQYKADPEDPRIMVRVKPGEKGEYTLLGSEGIDNDGDGRFNEDAEGYLDPNRNWGYHWMPPYVQRGAGNFPLSGLGIKAVDEFAAKHPNIIINFSFHNTGGMWLRVPADKSTQIPAADIAAYDVVGKEALKITPGYVYMPSHELYPTYGDSDGQMFFVHGSYSFVGELFMRSQETYKEKSDKPGTAKSTENDRSERSREQLKFNDNVVQGELYKEWKSYNHPVYGEIEIGGWVKMSSRLPHPFMLPDLVHRNASVVLLAANETPEVEIDVFDTIELGNKLQRVRVRLKNKNGLSTMTAQAVKDKLYTIDHLKVTGAKVIAGGKINNYRLNQVSYKEHKPEIQFFALQGHATAEYEFIVECKGTLKLEYVSQKAGTTSKTIQL